MDDAELRRLRLEWRHRTPRARNQFSELVYRAGVRRLRPYLTDAYGLEGCSLEDAAQIWVSDYLERAGEDRIADLLARATSMRGLQGMLERKAARWAVDRFRARLRGKLLRRIRDLPDAVPVVFVWISARIWMALAGGPRTPRDADYVTLATRVAGDPAVMGVQDEMLRQNWIGKNALRAAAAAVLRVHEAAARAVLLLDVILLLVGVVDARPLVLRQREARTIDDEEDVA